jgi:hypothetical protein
LSTSDRTSTAKYTASLGRNRITNAITAPSTSGPKLFRFGPPRKIPWSITLAVFAKP